MKPPRKAETQANTPTDWGNVADWYDGLVGDEGSEFHRQVIFPGVLKLLAIQKGEEVLDIACGQGVLCRVLRQHGARPTGIDAAPELIKIARERDPEGRYHIADAKDLSSVTADHYSAAACILAIQNIDTLPPVFEGVARALKVNGRFVLVMMHPCFRNPKETHWGWDEEEKVQYRRVDRYLLPRKEPIVTHPGQKTGEYTWSFHRPISMYFKSLRNAGLVVDALEEWPSHKTSTSGPRAGAENTARKEIPMFLAMRALKLPR
jgi:ubiquinone/menaquinone biosynthesis C-methylase UbiE